MRAKTLFGSYAMGPQSRAVSARTESIFAHRLARRNLGPGNPSRGTRRSILLARGLLGEARGAFAPGELVPDLARIDSARRPEDEKMVEKIGALGDERLLVLADRG